MQTCSKDIPPLDDEASTTVGDLLVFALSMARTRAEIRETFDKNEDVFKMINETQKNRLRNKWREAMERLK